MLWLRKVLTFSRNRRSHPLYWLTSDLAISPAPTPADWPSIHDAGVRSVVDLRSEMPDNATIVERHGLNYLRWPIEEHAAPSEAELRLVTDWILNRIESGGPVLVHCREGRGRSALVACATLVRLGLPLPNAYQALRRVRPQTSLSDEQADLLQRFAGRASATTDDR